MSNKGQTIIDDSQSVLVKTYKHQPFVPDYGKGCELWDTEGNRYLDFAVGYAVASLGHAPESVLKTIQEQAAKLMVCQASYMTEPKLECAHLLTNNSCFDLVYFANSGTESVEAAIKTARKWAYQNKGEHCNEIITFRHSFHGRTMGAASLTEKRLVQPYYAPYLPGVHFAEFNDINSVIPLISEKTAAIIVEPVQGEGGLIPAHACFLGALRKLCDQHKICLIFDEVQAGMGRLGTLFAYESFLCCKSDTCGNGENPVIPDLQPVEPDIACLAKGLGSGFPVGAMVAKQEFGEVIIPGDHGTTYGGNPLATAVAATVLKELMKDGFLAHVREVGNHIMAGLQTIQRNSNKIEDIRGMGLMIGIDTTVDIETLIRALQDNGLMTTQAGKRTLRMVPPLILTESEADEALEIIEKTLKKLD